jgi:hypothetical protein
VTADEKRWKAQNIYGGNYQHIGTFYTDTFYKAARKPGRGKKRPNFESTEQTLVHDLCADPKTPRQSSGFHGVTALGKRWQARICYGGKNRYIGAFATKQEAALAYDRAARDHGGGKKKLNYESIEAAEEAAAEAKAEHACAPGEPSGGPKRNFSAMNQPTQAEFVAAAMMQQAGQTFAGRWKRRKVTEHKDPESGGFGIRLAEAQGAEEDLHRIMVESLSRSKQLDAGDR